MIVAFYISIAFLSMMPNAFTDTCGVEVTCVCEQHNDIHCFFADISDHNQQQDLQYQLMLSAEGSSGRSRQQQSGRVEVSGSGPVRIGDIRVRLAEDARYECICVVRKAGQIIAADTLRRQ